MHSDARTSKKVSLERMQTCFEMNELFFKFQCCYSVARVSKYLNDLHESDNGLIIQIDSIPKKLF